MGQYDSPKRPLPWPLKDQLVQSRTTEEDAECEASSFVWPDDSDERVFIPFKLSLNEYVVLSSTIDVGSDIAYGEDAIRVKWLWDRNMRCHVSLCAEMVSVLETCEEFRDALLGFMGNAIGNEPTVQNQLREFIMADPDLITYFGDLVAEGAISEESRNRNMLKPSACDSGYLYNQAFVAQDVLKTLSVNVFTAMSVGANAYEWAKVALTIMPIVGGILPAIAITVFAASFVETFYTEYAIQWTANKDAIICSLWCLIEVDCELSLNKLIQFHIDQSGLSLPEEPLAAFEAVVAIVSANSVSGANVVHAMHLLLLTAMRLNQTMLGIDFASYAISVTAGGDTSDDGYLSCDPCGDEVWDEWDFSGGDDHDFYIAAGFGLFSNGFYPDPSDPTQIAFKRAHATYSYDRVELSFDAAVSGSMIASSIGNENGTGFVTMASGDAQHYAVDNLFNAGFFVDFVNSPNLTGYKIVSMRGRRV